MRSYTARLATSLAVVVSVTAAGCGGPTKSTVLPAELLPAEIAPAGAEAVALSLRVRVYVGADHRARVVGWEQELEQVFATSSGLLERGSGVRFELVESVGWERSGGPLDKTLAALVAQDPGLDVDVVVGLVDASEEAGAQFETLVATEATARHLVVRGFHWQAESKALGPTAAALSEGARDTLLVRRRRHKQSVLLTHAVADLFGQPAAMGTHYEPTIDAMDVAAGGLLRTSIPETLEARKQVVAANIRPTDVAGALRRIDTENLAQVHLLLEADKPGVAWEILEPLLELYPENVLIADAGCLVARAKAASGVGTRCATAVRLGSKSAGVFLVLASSRIVAEPQAAISALQKAELLLEPEASEWTVVAKTYKELSLATFAMGAAMKASKADTVLRWARETRSRYAVHVGVAPQQEGDYLKALQAGLKSIYAKDFSAGAASAKRLDQKFPKGVGGPLLRCELAMHKRDYSGARRACEAVLQGHPDNSWARYLQGVALARQQKSKEAIGLLAEAIERDATLEPAYKALAQLYRKSRDPRLAALKRAYKTHLKKAL